MIFQPSSCCYFYPEVILGNVTQIGLTQSYGNQNLYQNFLQHNSIIFPQFSQNSINHKVMALSLSIQQNYMQTNQILLMLNDLQQEFQTIENHYHSNNQEIEPNQKELSLQTYSQESCFLQKEIVPQIKSNRTHPKIKLMEKIFGKKHYSYKMAFDGKFPKILFKQRNISLKILLKNMSGETVINDNQILLNLKVFQNNGEEIFLDSSKSSFMHGLCQTQIEKGIGKFSKIHPRQVSRSFSGKGVCIIIYATSQQGQLENQGQSILTSEIQPLIFYNIKVMVKQTKKNRKNSIKNEFQ